jgi:hypothetical protein
VPVTWPQGRCFRARRWSDPFGKCQQSLGQRSGRPQAVRRIAVTERDACAFRSGANHNLIDYWCHPNAHLTGQRVHVALSPSKIGSEAGHGRLTAA